VHPHQASPVTALFFLLVVRVALGAVYSLTVPLWEADNEDSHLAYAIYLAKYHQLLQFNDPEAQSIWEKFQPPLYYLLLTPVLAGFHWNKTLPALEHNPYLASGEAGFNYALHPDHLERPAYQTALALYLARLLGVLISVIGVIFVYLSARRIWTTDQVTAWTATCLYAFWPQYLFTSSMVTNDVLVAALSAALFYLAILLVMDGFHLGRSLMLAILLGCALLTKLNAAALIPMALAACLMSIKSTEQSAKRLPHPGLVLLASGLLIGAILGLLGSFGFVTTHVLSISVFRQFLRYAPALGQLPGQSGSNLIISALQYHFRTLLASYGWGNLETYPWLYSLWSLGAILSTLGLMIGVINRRGKYASRIKLLTLIGLQILSSLTLSLALIISQQGIFVPGRYLLPILPSISFLLIGGWQALTPRRWHGRLRKAICLGVLLIGWSIPFETLAPAYAKPQPLKDMTKIDYPFHIFFNKEIELLGAIRPAPVQPDRKLDVSFCWQALTSLTKNYSVFLEVVGPDGEGYGQLDTYPGRGNYPTSFWRVNQPFCDEYTLQVRGDVPSPSAATLRVSLLDGVQGKPLGVTNASGETVDPNLVTLPIKIQADSRDLPRPSHLVNYRFGEGINLIGYDLETLSESNQVRVTLHWKVLEDIPDNYVVFIHLRDTPIHVYAQNDSQPRRGWYPTSLWESGEVILDEHKIALTEQTLPGALDLYLGLYDPTTGIRLAVFDAQGNPLVNDEVKLVEGLVFP